jgi:predicted pyridoxine 5'-phosphate oxidase superfamily flavin-nucleotide-binding protein
VHFTPPLETICEDSVSDALDPELCASFTMEGKAPRSVIVVTAKRVYTQCPKALVRSDLWNPAKHVPKSALPSSGEIMQALTKGRDRRQAV